MYFVPNGQMNKDMVAAAESQLLSLMEKYLIRKKGRKRKTDQENNEEEELAQTGTVETLIIRALLYDSLACLVHIPQLR